MFSDAPRNHGPCSCAAILGGHSGVAQLAERRPVKPMVAGSSPAPGAKSPPQFWVGDFSLNAVTPRRSEPSACRDDGDPNRGPGGHRRALGCRSRRPRPGRVHEGDDETSVSDPGQRTNTPVQRLGANAAPTMRIPAISRTSCGSTRRCERSCSSSKSTVIPSPTRPRCSACRVRPDGRHRTLGLGPEARSGGRGGVGPQRVAARPGVCDSPRRDRPQ
jgi:hypothetical protein